MSAYWISQWNQVRSRAITRALFVSVLIHALLFAGVELGYQVGWWKMSVWKEVTQHLDLLQVERHNVRQSAELARLQSQEETVQLTFVEVDPRLSTPEPPKEAKYYSSASSLAANPNPTKTDAKIPKIDGSQTQVPKTVQVAKADPKPVPPPAEPTPQPLQPKPQSILAEVEPGDSSANKPNPVPLQPQPEGLQQKPAASVRVRTVAEAKANRGIIEGVAMKQDGGVSRAALDTSLDVQGSPFGAYDAAFIAAVQARWYTLLEQRNVVRNQTGKVVVDFQLSKDGRIMEVNVSKNEVNDTLAWICQRAILDPAPYAAFPSDLRRLLNSDIREVRFTFFYN